MFKKSQSLGGGKNMGKTIEVFDVLVKTTHRLQLFNLKTG